VLYGGGRTRSRKIDTVPEVSSLHDLHKGPLAKLVAAGQMRAAEDGNVEILERFWNFETAKDIPEVVPPILVYADRLATHDSRNADAARMIYEQRSHQHSVPQYAVLIPVEMEPVEVRQPKSGQRT